MPAVSGAEQGVTPGDPAGIGHKIKQSQGEGRVYCLSEKGGSLTSRSTDLKSEKNKSIV